MSRVEKKDVDKSQNARPTASLWNICRTISTSLHSRQSSIHLFLQDDVSHPNEPRLALVCCRPIAEVFRFQSSQTPCVSPTLPCWYRSWAWPLGPRWTAIWCSNFLTQCSKLSIKIGGFPSLHAGDLFFRYSRATQSLQQHKRRLGSAATL